MEIKISIIAEDPDDKRFNANVMGSICFDEFGVAKKSRINSSSFGKPEKGKKRAKNLLRTVGERIRAELLNGK